MMDRIELVVVGVLYRRRVFMEGHACNKISLSFVVQARAWKILCLFFDYCVFCFKRIVVCIEWTLCGHLLKGFKL